ncbi:PucR family transcriptional regulator [Micromonospora profundi]|uniref:PucR family transcriptional regulator n=1 Tax=Micromonospora TaxID=1873 RepID=UPI0033BBA68F
MSADSVGLPQLPPWLREALRSAVSAELVERVVAVDLDAAFDHLRDDEEFVAQLTASVTENVRTLHRVAMGEVRIEELDLVQPRRLAVVQARRRVVQASLQLSYRVGFLTVWRDWVARLDAVETDPVRRGEGARLLTELVMAYQNAALAQVAREHMLSEESLQRSRDHLRFRLVKDLLSDDHVPDKFELLGLGYDIDADHIAVATRGDAGGTDWVRRAQSACAVTDVLHHPEQDGTQVRFLARRAWTAEARTALRRLLVEGGIAAEVSAPARGLEGLRHSYGQIGRIRRIREAFAGKHRRHQLAGDGVLEYADVRLEAIFLDDLPMAAQLVEEELAALSGSGSGLDVLRETLCVWLRERNYAATARALHLHENTVRNRIHRIEEMLGHDLQSRQAELMLALRLHDLLAGLDETVIPIRRVR